MATNRTTHLRLSQWIPSDPVLCSDFNFDNSRIDAAVNDRALVRLESGTVSAGAGSITMDLLYHDLTEYGELQVYLFPALSGQTAVTLQVGAATPVTLTTLTAGGNQGLIVHLCLLPGGIGGWWTTPGGTGTTSGTFQIAGVSAESFSELIVGCGSATFQSGTKWAVYGVKM